MKASSPSSLQTIFSNRNLVDEKRSVCAIWKKISVSIVSSVSEHKVYEIYCRRESNKRSEHELLSDANGRAILCCIERQLPATSGRTNCEISCAKQIFQSTAWNKGRHQLAVRLADTDPLRRRGSHSGGEFKRRRERGRFQWNYASARENDTNVN